MVRKRVWLAGIFLGVGLAGFLYSRWQGIAVFPAPETVMKITVPEKTTFGDLARWLNFPPGTANMILENAKPKYDFSKIVSGRELALTYDAFTGALKKLVYKIDSEEYLAVEGIDGQLSVERAAIPYQIEEAEFEGVITSSLYAAVVESGGDSRLALAIAEMFAWQVDFVADTRVDDSFKVIYEKRLLDGEYIMPGKILAARYTNGEDAFYGYYFSSAGTKAAYYDPEGNSLQKELLKAPLQYKYISSGFSYARVNPVTGATTPHRGIDYAAPYGTPAVSVGNGTVIQAGWKGAYGLAVTVRHNDTYTTIYGHFKSLAKGIKVGAKVSQGQIVGYVGSTGQSTGPHLHYEMHKFGRHVNPFTVEIPPGEPISKEDSEAFQGLASRFSERLIK